MDKNVIIHAKDQQIMADISSLGGNLIQQATMGGPKKTKIIIKNHDTGEVYGEYENKVNISGSQFAAMSIFGIKDKAVVFPSYNKDMNLDNSKPEEAEPTSENIVCLFCVSDGGCGTEPKDIYVVKNTDRIKPGPATIEAGADLREVFSNDMVMPFRFVNVEDDLDENLRKYYFGRKSYPNIGKIAYYFKSFDTDPQLHLRFADGTQITESVWESEVDQLAECYVEMRLRITRLDLRDYFEAVGWDRARISSLSLCSAWYDVGSDQYKYFQDIIPYTLLNFGFRPLADTTIAVDVIYSVYY